jgi:ketosteroid isomerase-like protein
MNGQDLANDNLLLVKRHFECEDAGEIEPALDLYTDDVVWEAPARDLTLHGKHAAGLNYRSMFASMSGVRTERRQCFATSDRVVDESIVTFRHSGNGIGKLPIPVGETVTMPVVHIFEMRNGRIARESVYETWPGTGPRVESERMQSVAKEPSPERILQFGFGYWNSKVLLSAVSLGVFTELSRAPLSGLTLAARLGLHARGYRDFFDTLVACGMLTRSGDLYSNSVEADVFLDRAKPSYIGGILELSDSKLYRDWGSLTEALRTGKRQNDAPDGEPTFDALYRDPERLENFLQGMTGISMGTARAIARNFPWDRYGTFIDVGGAQGALPVQVALAKPHLTGGSFDLPVVRPIFEEYVRSFGLDNRIRFFPGNFFNDPLPSADVLVMGQILHDWNLEEKKMLIGKAFEALPAGGALLVYEALIDDDRRHNAFGLLMSLNMLIETDGGFDYTGADCAGWMRESGFRETWVEHLTGPHSMVVGIK